MPDRLVTIRRFTHTWEADMARVILEAEGIPAYLVNADTVNVNWLWSNAVGGIRLRVPEKFARTAAEALSTRPDLLPDNEVESLSPRPRR